MFYVNNQTSKSIRPDMLINILGASCAQRTQQQHEQVYQYLLTNPELIEIERSKSLNARLKVIANIVVKDSLEGEDADKFTLIEKVKVKREMDQKKKMKMKRERKLKDEDLQNLYEIYIYFACVDREKLIEIMAADEKYLSKNMEALKKYSLFKDMQYSQLLHIAYYLQTISFKYKQYVYREGQQSEYIYLVEEGEFNFEKRTQQKEDENLKKSQQKARNKKPKRYEVQGNENPNRLKRSKSKDYKIGTVQGNCGQSFGEEEVLTHRIREYSVRCESTENVLLKIKKQYFMNIINTPTVMNWMRNENEKKIVAKKQLYERILATKKNYGKYMKYIDEENNHLPHASEIEERIKASVEGNEVNNIFDPKLKNIEDYGPADYYGRNKKKKKSYFLKNQKQERQKQSENAPYYSPNNKSRDKIHVDAENMRERKITLEEERKEENYEETFGLTKAHTQILRNNSKAPTKSVYEKVPTQNSEDKKGNSVVLPSLYSVVKQRSQQNTIESMIGQNWSASRPNIELNGMRNKFSGMIDSNSLIKEKEYILSRRNAKQVDRDEIFPSDFIKMPKKSMIKNTLTSKKEARNQRSAVHSKDYMQKLLIEALKKAGYNTEKVSPQKVEMDVKNNLRVPKQMKEKYKSAQVRSQINYEHEVLQNNQFDQCYFNPL